MNNKYKHQERHAIRQKEKGLVRVTLWCPVQNTSQLKYEARKFRNKHFAEQRGETYNELVDDYADHT